jgi:hypothetical protein
MKTFTLTAAILAICLMANVNAFAPSTKVSLTTSTTTRKPTAAFGFLGDKERDKLTRDSEPEQFFAT